MTIDTNKCEITARGDKTITLRTARGRLSYPWLFSPNKDNKYSASLLFSKKVDLSALAEAVDLAAKALFGQDYAKKYPGLKKPLLETAKSPAIGADAEEFPTFIRAATIANPSRRPPQVVDHNTDPVTDQSEVYPGRWAMLTVNVGAYFRDGNRGVTCYLNNVQILEHGDKLGGGGSSASDDFQPVDVSDSADALFR